MKLKKWLLAVAAFAVMAVICAVAAGAEFYVDVDFEYNELDDGTVEITDYYGYAEKVDIPKTIDGMSVTSIGKYAFYNKENLESITIPNSVKSIGERAFNECTNLTSVTISNGVTSIGSYAFGSCESLVTITIPNSVTGIAAYAFNNTALLENQTTAVKYVGKWVVDCDYDAKSVTIKNGTVGIADSAFDDCNSLTSITIPDSVASIGNSAFENCTSLTEIKVATKNSKYVSVNGVLYNKNKTTLICYPAGKKDKSYKIINSVSSIGNNAFNGCDSLTNITIPNSVTSIGDLAFNGCTSLKSITMPNSITSISGGVFYGCTSLTSITIPDGVTSIRWSAFGHCASLKSITIPDSVTSIGECAFYGSGLTTVKLPEKLNDIGVDAFGSTPIIKNQKTEIKYIGSTIISCDTDAEELTIGDNVTTIASYAFMAYIRDSYSGIASLNNNLKSVIIPKNVKYIGEYSVGYYRVIDGQKSGGNGYYKTDNFTIKCYSNSVAERYAKDNEIDYELLDKPTLTKVTGAKLTGRAADALHINWTKNANADGYIIEMYQNGKWARVAKITDNSTTTFRKAGLKASTVYKFRVKAYKMSGKTAVYGAYSATVTARTNPSVMTGAKLGGRAADALRINWTKNASADGYIVDMYQGNKWVRVGKITNNSTTTFRKAGLKASSVYKFRVRAYKMSGSTALYGNYSAIVTARTNPSVMTGVKISGKAKDALRVNWTKNASAQGYIVEMYKGGKWVRVAKITNGNTTTFRKAGLAKNTTYKFRVKAYYMSGKTALYGNYGSVSGKTAAK